MTDQQEDTMDSLLDEKFALEQEIADGAPHHGKVSKLFDELRQHKASYRELEQELENASRSYAKEIDDEMKYVFMSIHWKQEELDEERMREVTKLKNQLADVLKRMAMLPK